MTYVAIWFILTEGFGFIEPQYVHKADMSCGLPGIVIGVQLDSLVNPTKAYWVDPGFKDLHCVIDISARVQGLEQGEYEIATTIMDGEGLPYNYHDPHTSVKFLRVFPSGVVPKKPVQIRIQP